MTRKDFELIAKALKESRFCFKSDSNTLGYRQWLHTVKTMADALQTTNPAFDRARFLRACGLEE